MPRRRLQPRMSAQAHRVISVRRGIWSLPGNSEHRSSATYECAPWRRRLALLDAEEIRHPLLDRAVAHVAVDEIGRRHALQILRRRPPRAAPSASRRPRARRRRTAGGLGCRSCTRCDARNAASSSSPSAEPSMIGNLVSAAIAVSSARVLMPVKNSASTPDVSYAFPRAIASATPVTEGALVRANSASDLSRRASTAAFILPRPSSSDSSCTLDCP